MGASLCPFFYLSLSNFRPTVPLAIRSFVAGECQSLGVTHEDLEQVRIGG